MRMNRQMTSQATIWRWVFMAFVLATSMLSGCATSKPRTVEIPQARLQEMVARRFPYRARWLDVMEVAALNPRLRLQPGAGTISADIDVEATDKVFGQTYRGVLSISSGLRYEPMDYSFRFTGIKVDKFEVTGLPTAYGPETARLGTLLAGQLLENYPIYTLTDQQQQMLKDTNLQVSAMRISETGLSITVSPAPM